MRFVIKPQRHRDTEQTNDECRSLNLESMTRIGKSEGGIRTLAIRYSSLCLCVSVVFLFSPRELAAGGSHNADSPPVIPVGFDAFRMWDRWAYLRIGQRTYMTST